MIYTRILGIIAVAVILAACQKAVTNKSKLQPLSDLAGSEWGPAENPYDQFVGFKANGEMMGSGGCNNFFGTYELNDGEIKIGPLASTKKACPDSMQAETEFLSQLQSARTVEATHMKLTFFDEAGNAIMSLRRRDWD